MTNPYSYLEITDDTTHVSIWDGAGGITSYLLSDGWAPRIAGLRQSELGGAGEHEDVTEELDITITGATAGAALSNLNKLERLLDQAERFWRGQRTSPVKIKYAPKGATVSSLASPLQALILGRPAGDRAAMVALSPRFNKAGMYYVIERVRVRFVRQGEWKHTNTTASSAATNNGDLATINLTTALGVKSPTQLQWTNSYLGIGPGLLFVSDQSDSLQVVNAESMYGGVEPGFSSVNDAAANARNTNVLRFTPSSTAEFVVINGAGFSMHADEVVVGIWANVRNNSGTTVFKLRFWNGLAPTVIDPATYTPWVTIDTSSLNPRWIFCGFMRVLYPAATLGLITKASAAAGTLDIDSLVLYGVTRQAVQVIELDEGSPNLISGPTSVDHRRLTHPAPAVTHTSTYTRYQAYNGDPFLATKSASIYALLLEVGQAAAPNFWRRSAGGAVLQNTFTATRTAAYLTPQ